MVNNLTDLSGLAAIYEPGIGPFAHRGDGSRLARLQAEAGDTVVNGMLITSGGVAIIPAIGVLTKYGSWWFDGPSTEALRSTFARAQADDKAKAILLLIDSPGGQAAGVNDLSSEIAKSSKPVWAYVEDLGASGGYYLAAAAQRITANSSAIVGNVGTYVVLDDWVKAFDEAGVVRSVVKFGERKGDGLMGTPITDEVKAEFQREVDFLGKQFLDFVATQRKLNPDQAAEVATARIYTAPEALDAGLIDNISTFTETLAELTTVVNPGPPVPSNTKGAWKMAQIPTQAGAATVETPPVDPPAPAPPRAATLAELRSAFPEADHAFLIQCLDETRTLEQAGKAWTAGVTARAKEAETKLDEAEKKLTEVTAEVERLKAARVPSSAVEFAAGAGGSSDGIPDRAAIIAAAVEKFKAAKAAHRGILGSTETWAHQALRDAELPGLTKDEAARLPKVK